MTVRAGIIGATGYAGEFLIRILARHPQVKLAYLSSGHAAGRDLGDELPSLKGLGAYTLGEEDADKIAAACDVVFIAKKSVDSMKYAPLLLDKGIKVIDIGGEFRLKDAAAYEKWYGEHHTCPELLPQAVYGLCELKRKEVAKAKLVANPGCYATASILGLRPFVQAWGERIQAAMIAASSGISGAGRTAMSDGRNLFVNCFNSHSAYKTGKHKHTPEIEQEAGCMVTFIPQLASIDRGILAVISFTLPGGVPEGDPLDILRKAYAGEPFIRIFKTVEEVTTANVRGTNYCDMTAVRVDRSRAVVAVTAIDNLVKGASGQAVQNLNLMCGLEETAGLKGVWF
ncbi:MAG: N-acetyl-gamma-glutamyl-phosphate reductase [Planctomycetota bacterium]